MDTSSQPPIAESSRSNVRIRKGPVVLAGQRILKAIETRTGNRPLLHPLECVSYGNSESGVVDQFYSQ